MILYEMIAGRHPFERKSVVETLTAIMREPPTPVPLGGRVPVSVERLVLHCLEKDPGDRFQITVISPWRSSRCLGSCGNRPLRITPSYRVSLRRRWPSCRSPT
jgi:serine/threonine protein kinase